MVVSEFCVNTTKACIHPSFSGYLQWCNVWGVIFWHALGPLLSNDHVHPFMTSVCKSSGGYVKQAKIPRHKAQLIPNPFLEHDRVHRIQKASTVPDLNTTEHLWMLWNKRGKEKAALKGKWGLTQYQQGNLYRAVSVYANITKYINFS